METPLIAGTAQVAYLASLIGNPKGVNARPVQALNQRTIVHYQVPTTSAVAGLPGGAVAAIVLLLIGVFVGAFIYCATSTTKEKRIIFLGKVTSYEWLGWFTCPPIRKSTDASINGGEEEEEEEEEEAIREPIKAKGKGKASPPDDEADDDDEESGRKPARKTTTKGEDGLGEFEDNEDDDDRGKKASSAKKKGTYGTVGGDDDDFDAPSSKKTAANRFH